MEFSAVCLDCPRLRKEQANGSESGPKKCSARCMLSTLCMLCWHCSCDPFWIILCPRILCSTFLSSVVLKLVYFFFNETTAFCGTWVRTCCPRICNLSPVFRQALPLLAWVWAPGVSRRKLVFADHPIVGLRLYCSMISRKLGSFILWFMPGCQPRFLSNSSLCICCKHHCTGICTGKFTLW